MLAIVGRALLWSLLGAALAPVVALLVEIIVSRATPGCGQPFDSGGCQMGIAAIVLASIPVGAAASFAVAILHGLVRRR
ncbi:hypothetical protein [Methylobacterium nonmethylotrophicum]|uniref:Uncharacterized protein n=1 Tax=Methylobacterium nonmethylotrophicum TaxID=1141884 RepID=A0A4Z0NJA8_9HYPH|nr:hypothetical protein [Methylobacterium nonmethylotrophicum]TGD95775.1 hypothetical protein EU555_26445 [Methylobacterium nonmethylotrophicum]